MPHPTNKKTVWNKTMWESLVFSKPYEYACKCFFTRKLWHIIGAVSQNVPHQKVLQEFHSKLQFLRQNRQCPTHSERL